MDSTLKKTVFHDLHVSLGARMAPFGGWDMPIQYSGILMEHEATRTGATLFDTCHMGKFLAFGAGAEADLERLVSCDVASLEIGQCRYGLLCNAAGGVLDDLLVYRLAPAEFMIVVNASTQDDDFAWFTRNSRSETRWHNLGTEIAKLDFQGPRAPAIARDLLEEPFAGLRYYRWQHSKFLGARVLISRTGYTGEIGFELYSDPETLRAFWNAAMERGALPAGLGARDTLRLEMGLPLYGHELSVKHNAAEAGFTRALSSEKYYIGDSAVRDSDQSPQRLVGLTFQDRRAARAGDAIESLAGKPIGIVTSGSFAPSLGVAVALGYVRKDQLAAGAVLGVRTARQTLHCVVTPPPFYKNATARKPLAEFLPA